MMLPRTIRICVTAVCGLLVWPGAQATARTPHQVVAVWRSSADGTRKLTRSADLPLKGARGRAEGNILRVDPSRRFQSMVGFGAAMTDASAEIFQQRLSPAARDALFAELFGRRAGELALSFLRVPIGASDFSSRHYSLDDMPKGERDPGLAHFSMAGPDAAQVPALLTAQRYNPDLVLLASPWSAPGWMKDSDSLITGRLQREAFAPFAAYLSRYLIEMERRGLPVALLTVQNEPHFEPVNYPGMRFESADRALFFARFLGPQLAKHRQGTGVLDWDHNWDQPQAPLAVLADPAAARFVSGVAWHCYAGDVAAMAKVRATYPGKQAYLTECSGGEWNPGWGNALGWLTDNLIIAATRFGSRGTLLWNLALDENHGPHLGGCGDCRGVVTVDSKTGIITRNPEYYALGHASRFVRRGARRIASREVKGLASVAFRNPDGALVLIVHNRAQRRLAFAVETNQTIFHAALPAGEIATFAWR